MWLRRNADSAELLTVARDPHAGDNRIAVKFQYPNNWRLSINPVRKADAGLYMCQISTHPPRAILANLTVLRKYWFRICGRNIKIGDQVDVGINILTLLILHFWWKLAAELSSNEELTKIDSIASLCPKISIAIWSSVV